MSATSPRPLDGKTPEQLRRLHQELVCHRRIARLAAGGRCRGGSQSSRP